MEKRAALLDGVRVLDGGMASELEYLGANIDGPLWSAHVLEDAPEKIVAVHRAYIAAGADCIETASYQVSSRGYAEFGLAAEQADAALLKAVQLARKAAAEFPERRVVVAASLGPFGAALHNGAEYHGNYGVGVDELVAFHRERIRVLAEAGECAPDLLAFETLPSLQEAQAIGEALARWPELAAWFCFTCKDERHVAHGELLAEVYAQAAPHTHGRDVLLTVYRSAWPHGFGIPRARAVRPGGGSGLDAGKLAKAAGRSHRNRSPLQLEGAGLQHAGHAGGGSG